MKKRILLPCVLVGALAFGISLSNSFADTQVNNNNGDESTYLQEESETYLRAYGWIVGMQSGINDLGFTEAELDTFFDGMRLAWKGDRPPVTEGNIQDKLQHFLEDRAENYQKIKSKEMEEIAAKNKREAESFWRNLDKDKTVNKTASGLYYQISEKGKAPIPTEKDEVTIHYTGTLLDGTVFDSSEERNQPATFPLDQVIPGFREGLQLIGKNGKIKLFIPPELGYGNRDMPGIPPGSTLIFEVKLLEVIPPDAPSIPKEE